MDIHEERVDRLWLTFGCEIDLFRKLNRSCPGMEAFLKGGLSRDSFVGSVFLLRTSNDSSDGKWHYVAKIRLIEWGDEFGVPSPPDRLLQEDYTEVVFKIEVKQKVGTGGTTEAIVLPREDIERAVLIARKEYGEIEAEEK